MQAMDTGTPKRVAFIGLPELAAAFDRSTVETRSFDLGAAFGRVFPEAMAKTSRDKVLFLVADDGSDKAEAIITHLRRVQCTVVVVDQAGSGRFSETVQTIAAGSAAPGQVASLIGVQLEGGNATASAPSPPAEGDPAAPPAAPAAAAAAASPMPPWEDEPAPSGPPWASAPEAPAPAAGAAGTWASVQDYVPPTPPSDPAPRPEAPPAAPPWDQPAPEAATYAAPTPPASVPPPWAAAEPAPEAQGQPAAPPWEHAPAAPWAAEPPAAEATPYAAPAPTEAPRAPEPDPAPAPPWASAAEVTPAEPQAEPRPAPPPPWAPAADPWGRTQPTAGAPAGPSAIPDWAAPPPPPPEMELPAPGVLPRLDPPEVDPLQVDGPPWAAAPPSPPSPRFAPEPETASAPWQPTGPAGVVPRPQSIEFPVAASVPHGPGGNPIATYASTNTGPDQEVGTLGKTLAIVAAKGGVGKTTLSLWVTQAIGAALGQANRTVGLIDANIGQADISKMLGLSGQTRDLAHLADSRPVPERDLDKTLVHVPWLNAYCLFGPREPMTVTTDAAITALSSSLRLMRRRFSWTIIDSPVGSSHDQIIRDFVIKEADLILIVVAPDEPTIEDTQIFLREISAPAIEGGMNYPMDRVAIVMNLSNPHAGMSLDDVEARLGRWRVLGEIPSVGGVQKDRNRGVVDVPPEAASIIAEVVSTVTTVHVTAGATPRFGKKTTSKFASADSDDRKPRWRRGKGKRSKD